MTRILSVLLAFAVAAFALGCGGSGDSASETDTGETAAEMAQGAGEEAMGEAAMTAPIHAEIACASCIYHMDGITECTPAVRIQDKTMLLTGVEIDTHGSGLCAAAQHAHLKGQIVDGKFVATALDLDEH
jgi:hypothetical protein